MLNDKCSTLIRTLNAQSLPRVAVIGAGVAGLTCAGQLRLRGWDSVVFEADDRLGGRCSSRRTRSGVFDDGAQCINGDIPLAADAVQRPGVLPALHPWTVVATPAEEELNNQADKKDEEEADVTRSLKLIGAVGVPSMESLADFLARPLEVRLNSRIIQARRVGIRWVLSSADGEIEEDFQALVLAMPAPLAMPLLRESPELTASLLPIRYRSRWVLLLGTERPISLPGHRAFQGSPIERVAAMHSKPGRLATGPQRWFVEADARWSSQHENEDADMVADLLLENFRAYAGRSVIPSFLQAHQWRNAFVETPATTPRGTQCLWDDKVQLGVCGDSVVSSQVDQVYSSGVDMARVAAERLSRQSGPHSFSAPKRDLGQVLEASL